MTLKENAYEIHLSKIVTEIKQTFGRVYKKGMSNMQ